MHLCGAGSRFRKLIPGTRNPKGKSPDMQSAAKQLLLVDDRVKYANLISDIFRVTAI